MKPSALEQVANKLSTTAGHALRLVVLSAVGGPVVALVTYWAVTAEGWRRTAMALALGAASSVLASWVVLWAQRASTLGIERQLAALREQFDRLHAELGGDIIMQADRVMTLIRADPSRQVRPADIEIEAAVLSGMLARYRSKPTPPPAPIPSLGDRP